MANNLTLHVSNFNDRVKAMNQTKSQDLRLTAVEANNLLADIFAVLAHNTRIQAEGLVDPNAVTSVVMDGGSFK